VKIAYIRHRKSLPWLRSSKDHFIYEGVFQVHRVHTGVDGVHMWHITIGPFAWAIVYWRK